MAKKSKDNKKPEKLYTKEQIEEMLEGKFDDAEYENPNKDQSEYMWFKESVNNPGMYFIVEDKNDKPSSELFKNQEEIDSLKILSWEDCLEYAVDPNTQLTDIKKEDLKAGFKAEFKSRLELEIKNKTSKQNLYDVINHVLFEMGEDLQDKVFQKNGKVVNNGFHYRREIVYPNIGGREGVKEALNEIGKEEISSKRSSWYKNANDSDYSKYIDAALDNVDKECKPKVQANKPK